MPRWLRPETRDCGRGPGRGQVQNEPEHCVSSQAIPSRAEELNRLWQSAGISETQRTRGDVRKAGAAAGRVFLAPGLSAHALLSALPGLLTGVQTVAGKSQREGRSLRKEQPFSNGRYRTALPGRRQTSNSLTSGRGRGGPCGSGDLVGTPAGQKGSPSSPAGVWPLLVLILDCEPSAAHSFTGEGRVL